MAARKGSASRSAPAGSVGHGEYVVYPGTRAEVYDVLERLSAAAGDSPDFGTPGLSLDRSRLTVRWFGELPAAVQRVVDSAEGVAVTVQPTAYRPGDLRAEAQRLTAGHPDVVVAASARPEGDGIDVLVPPAAAAAAGGAQQAVAAVPSPFPLVAAVAEA
jgi:hypothetical protein